MKVYKRVVNLLVLVLHLVKGVELGEKSSITKNTNIYIFGLGVGLRSGRARPRTRAFR